MRIQLRMRAMDPAEELREQTLRHLYSELSRFGPEVRRVTVHVSDVNGPRGGEDKRCQVSISGPRFGRTSVSVEARDAPTAIAAALARGARSVGRALERSRERRTLERPRAPAGAGQEAPLEAPRRG